MSGAVAPSALPWAALPWVRQVRLATVAVLAAANTVAGQRVTDQPLLDWTDADLPAIAIYQKIKRDPRSLAGGPPSVDLSLTLRIQATVIDTDGAAAMELLDIIEQQILDALIGDPVWLGLAGRIFGIDTQRNIARSGEAFRPELIHEIMLHRIETYPNPPVSPLLSVPGKFGQPIGVPHQVLDVTAPLTIITTTDQTLTNDGTRAVPETLTAQTLLLPQP